MGNMYPHDGHASRFSRRSLYDQLHWKKAKDKKIRHPYLTKTMSISKSVPASSWDCHLSESDDLRPRHRYPCHHLCIRSSTPYLTGIGQDGAHSRPNTQPPLLTLSSVRRSDFLPLMLRWRRILRGQQAARVIFKRMVHGCTEDLTPISPQSDTIKARVSVIQSLKTW